jgi:hypothetical protein
MEHRLTETRVLSCQRFVAGGLDGDTVWVDVADDAKGVIYRLRFPAREATITGETLKAQTRKLWGADTLTKN